MSNQITVEWLQKQQACPEGVVWFQQHALTQPVEVIRALMDDDKLNWANWLIVRVMTRPENLAYAIFAAEQVLDLYEKQYPNDSRPRQALEAAKACLINNTPETRAAAREASAAREAARAAREAAMLTKILNHGLALLEASDAQDA